VKDEIEAVPGNRVKSLFDVKLQDNSGCMALVTADEKVSGVYEIFSNVPAMDEPRLVGVNQVWILVLILHCFYYKCVCVLGFCHWVGRG
jgi:hypothetical protein